jgi:hypothetical protein
MIHPAAAMLSTSGHTLFETGATAISPDSPNVQSGDDDADTYTPFVTPQVPCSTSCRAMLRWIAASSST